METKDREGQNKNWEGDRARKLQKANHHILAHYVNTIEKGVGGPVKLEKISWILPSKSPIKLVANKIDQYILHWEQIPHKITIKQKREYRTN